MLILLRQGRVNEKASTKSLQKDTSRKVKQLTAKLEAAKAAIERASHTVDDETYSDLVKIVVSKQFPPDSCSHFWQQQL